jgi:hypothetical protein
VHGSSDLITVTERSVAHGKPRMSPIDRSGNW